MATLNRNARETIKEHGMTVKAYIQHHCGPDAKSWGGDVCGCVDDRCANGFHHDDVEDCRCLPVLLDQMLAL